LQVLFLFCSVHWIWHNAHLLVLETRYRLYSGKTLDFIFRESREGRNGASRVISWPSGMRESRNGSGVPSIIITANKCVIHYALVLCCVCVVCCNFTNQSWNLRLVTNSDYFRLNRFPKMQSENKASRNMVMIRTRCSLQC
jgi:hypothetical protein